jgi:hypothetical protein
MKSLLFTAIIALITSCGGWSKGQDEAFKESCKAALNYDCDCSLKITKEKYPNASDFNEKGASDLELSKAIEQNCAK